MKKQNEENEKRIKVSTIVYAFLILLMIVLGVGSILAYGTRTEIGTKIAAKIAVVIPFPAAIINWKNVVYINDVQANLASVEKFYQTQDFAKEGLRIDFTTEDGKKRLRIKQREVIDKMVEDEIIEILAKRKGIFVTNDDAEKVVAQKLNEFGTADDVKNDLLKSYGWTMDDFKKRVVLPSIYMEELAQKVTVEEISDNAKVKDKILQAQKQLESGKDFAEVARSYSEGTSREKGGELGWAKKDQVVPELQAALFGKDTPEKNSIIESSIGFHIVEIENRKKENSEDVLQLRQIFVAKNTFADWLESEKKQMKVVVPLADFIWDAQLGSVDFRDEKMRVFEKQERAKVQGDASIMF
ncbi:MAG: Foldase protein PrsA [Parcubacteria group bacterium GW2011_GWD2_38_11]|nr:MAG: Foldase protein PrsA [Parcubacteria group bacterium GW2011_GWD2_38_11]